MMAKLRRVVSASILRKATRISTVNTVPLKAKKYSDEPISTPTAATAQMLAAEVSPLIETPSRTITPAPMKPMPCRMP